MDPLQRPESLGQQQPSTSEMPLCKKCGRQGCLHFRRGSAHIMAHPESKDATSIPSIGTAVESHVESHVLQKGGKAGEGRFDILVPETCPCHGCIHKVVRVDLNRGPVKSLKYSMGQDGKWGSSFGHFRYKKDTEIVLGCSGRHQIIDEPKAGRYAQLWCRSCCNCEMMDKPVGLLAGCCCIAHWYTITNRSYHERTPFHQLACMLLKSSYDEALAAGSPFAEMIGPIGQMYYKSVGKDAKDAQDAKGDSTTIPAKSEKGGGDDDHVMRGDKSKSSQSPPTSNAQPRQPSTPAPGQDQDRAGGGEPHAQHATNPSGVAAPWNGGHAFSRMGGMLRRPPVTDPVSSSGPGAMPHGVAGGLGQAMEYGRLSPPRWAGRRGGARSGGSPPRGAAVMTQEGSASRADGEVAQPPRRRPGRSVYWDLPDILTKRRKL